MSVMLWHLGPLPAMFSLLTDPDVVMLLSHIGGMRRQHATQETQWCFENVRICTVKWRHCQQPIQAITHLVYLIYCHTLRYSWLVTEPSRVISCKSRWDQRGSCVPQVCRVKTVCSAILQNRKLLWWFVNPPLFVSVFLYELLGVGFLQGSDMFSIACYFPGISFLVMYSISHFKEHIYRYKARLELMLTYFFFLDLCIFFSY